MGSGLLTTGESTAPRRASLPACYLACYRAGTSTASLTVRVMLEAPWYFTGVLPSMNYIAPNVVPVTHTHSLASEPLERL